MRVLQVIPQLRTTGLDESIDFYVNRLGFELDFRYQDFYAGIRVGECRFHLKLVDSRDPSIDFVRDGNHLHLFIEVDSVAEAADLFRARGVTLVTEPHTTDYTPRQFSIEDDQGHTLYFSEGD